MINLTILDQSLVFISLFSHYLQLYIIKDFFYYTIFFGYILTLFLYELFQKDPSIPCSPLKVVGPSLKTSELLSQSSTSKQMLNTLMT